MEYRKDLIPGIVLFIFSVLYLLLSCQIEIFTGSGATPLDARFAPRFWGSILLILSAMLIYRGIKKKNELDEYDKSEKLTLKEKIYNSREVFLTFGSLTIYILGLEPVGFILMTILYIFVQIMILTEKQQRNYKAAIILAVPSAVIIDYVFVRMLNVMLPSGILGF